MHSQRRNKVRMRILHRPKTAIGFNVEYTYGAIVATAQYVITRGMDQDASDPIFVCAECH
jgi:hypothetical protein